MPLLHSICVTYLDGGIFHSQSTSDLGSTTTIHNSVVTNQVANDAKSIVQRTLGFVDDLVTINTNTYSQESIGPHHLVTSSYEYRNGTAVGTVFNDKHLLTGGTESHLSHTASSSKLL